MLKRYICCSYIKCNCKKVYQKSKLTLTAVCWHDGISFFSIFKSHVIIVSESKIERVPSDQRTYVQNKSN